MHPNVIVHTTVSLDTAFTGFAIDLERHYAVLLPFGPDGILTGRGRQRASMHSVEAPSGGGVRSASSSTAEGC